MSRTGLESSDSTGVERSDERWVHLRCGSEWIRIPFANIVEISEPRSVVPIPGAPVGTGVINHRGSVRTVVDIALALERSPEPLEDDHRLVHVHWRGTEIALAADDVVSSDSAAGSRAEAAAAVLDLSTFFERFF